MATQTGQGSDLLMMAELGGWIGSGYLGNKWGAKNIAGMARHSTSKRMSRYFTPNELAMNPQGFYDVATKKYGTTGLVHGGRYGREAAGMGMFPKRAGGLIKSQSAMYSRRQMGAAMRIAGTKGTGITTKAGWKAAMNQGLVGQYSKIALGKAGGVAHKLFMAGWAASLGFEVVKGSFLALRGAGRRERKLEMGGGAFMNTQAVYTERQRALRAITSSRMSTRSALGGEAQLMHR